MSVLHIRPAAYSGILHSLRPQRDPTVPTQAQREATRAADTNYAADTQDYDGPALRRLMRLTKRHGPLRAAHIMDKRGYWKLGRTARPITDPAPDPASAVQVRVDIRLDDGSFRRSWTNLRGRMHLLAPHCADQARCRWHNPRGNPPPAPHTAGYRRRTRRRNTR